MEKEFVPYELALRMKQLGFDEDCCKYVYVGDTGNNVDHYLEVEPSKAKNYNKDSLCISQPLFSQAFRWFDYSTEWSGFIVPSKEEGCFDWWIQNYTDHQLSIESDEWYRGREEAELACLEKLIKIVEQTNAEMTDYGVYK